MPLKNITRKLQQRKSIKMIEIFTQKQVLHIKFRVESILILTMETLLKSLPTPLHRVNQEMKALCRKI